MNNEIFAQLMGFFPIKKNRVSQDCVDVMASYSQKARAFYTNGSGMCDCSRKHVIRCHRSVCVLGKRAILCSKDCPKPCHNQLFWEPISLSGMTVEAVDEYVPHLVLVAEELIPSGKYIGEYNGQVKMGAVAEDQKFCLPLHRHDVDKDSELSDKLPPMHIDSREQGSIFRLMPHDHSPNCVYECWIVGAELKLFVRAGRVIQPGETLTLFYPQLDPAASAYQARLEAAVASILVDEGEERPLVLRELPGAEQVEEQLDQQAYINAINYPLRRSRRASESDADRVQRGAYRSGFGAAAKDRVGGSGGGRK